MYAVFTSVAEHEHQLEIVRQLLNQEVQFNLRDTFVNFGGTKTGVSLQSVVKILEHASLNSTELLATSNDTQPTASPTKRVRNLPLKCLLESTASLFGLYNDGNSLNVSFCEFSQMFLSREDHLLAKMVVERDMLGAMPQYLLNYCRHIIATEAILHHQLIQWRSKNSIQAAFWLESIDNRQLIKRRIFEIFKQGRDSDVASEEKSLLVLQYLKVSPKAGSLHNNLRVALTLDVNQMLSNSRFPVESWIWKSPNRTLQKNKSPQATMSRTVKSPQSPSNKKTQIAFLSPYGRQEMNDCLRRPKLINLTSYRQLRSIQNYLKRRPNANLGSPKSAAPKPSESLMLLLKTLKQIGHLQHLLDYSKVLLSLRGDFHPVLFWEGLLKQRDGAYLLPSSLQIHLSECGVQVRMKDIFSFYRRYNSAEGRMDFDGFCSIFDVIGAVNGPQGIKANRKVLTLGGVTAQTKKLYVQVLVEALQAEMKKNAQKLKLMEAVLVPIHSVLSQLAVYRDGHICQQDFGYAFEECLGLEVSKEELNCLWVAIGSTKETEYVKQKNMVDWLAPYT